MPKKKTSSAQTSQTSDVAEHLVFKTPDVAERVELKEKKYEAKSRYWACVVYPDSAPEDWRDVLKISGLRCAISPLHDKDINPTGEPKKPHWHVLLCWDGPTTFSNAKRFVRENLNAPIPQELKSVRGMYNYFSHKDNPEKAQYDEKAIGHINGFSLAEFCELTRGEVNEAIKHAMHIVRSKNITEYATLLEFLQDCELWDEWDVVKNNVLLFNTYIRSRRWSGKDESEDADESKKKPKKSRNK